MLLPVVAAISTPADLTLGSVIGSPQAITGPWEQQIALGKVVGFDVGIRTAIQGAPASLSGATQRVDFIWITTYVRAGGHSQRTFWSSQVPAQFSWRHNEIALRIPGDGAHGVQAVDLDLRFNPNTSEWRGRLQNEWYAGNVVLTRPVVPHAGVGLAGDWIAGDPRTGGYACKHAALGADGAVVIWSDIIDLPGVAIYPNGTNPPKSAHEWYGDLDMDAEVKDIGTNLLFFTGTDMSGDIVLGSVNARGDVFSGESAHFGNGPSNGKFNPFTWHRTTRDCWV